MPIHRNKPLQDDDLLRIIQSICPVADYSRAWSRRISDDSDKWLVLTDEQKLVLESLKNKRRVVITGRSGTGKTLLALTYARSMAERGNNVLFLLFNKNLASSIENSLTDTSVKVKTYHNFCFQLARSVGHKLTLDDDNSAAILNNAKLNGKIPHYDVIVIDECQVFRPEWIEALLDCYQDSELLSCCDETQVFSFESCISAVEIARLINADSPFSLSINLRSPRKIFTRLYDALPKTNYQQASLRPDDNDALVELSTPSPLSTLITTIEELASNKIIKNDITVIYLDTDPTSNLPAEIRNKVSSIETIRKFRGLESPVVIVYAPDVFTSLPEITCAYSRATTLCIVIFNAINFLEDTKDEFQKLVKQKESTISNQLNKLNFYESNNCDLVEAASATSTIQWSMIWNGYVMYHTTEQLQALQNLLWKLHFLIFDKIQIYEIYKPTYGAGKETVVTATLFKPDNDSRSEYNTSKLMLFWCADCGMWARKSDDGTLSNCICLDCKIRHINRVEPHGEVLQFDDSIINPDKYDREFKRKMSPFLVALGRMTNRLNTDQKKILAANIKGIKHPLYEAGRILLGIDILKSEVDTVIVAKEYSEKLWDSIPMFSQITSKDELIKKMDLVFSVYFNTDKLLQKTAKGAYIKI